MKLEQDRLWIHVIYAQHEQFAHDLERLLLVKVIDSFHGERWPRHEPGFLTRMIWTSIVEHVSQPICPACNGDKQTIISQEEADTLNKAILNAQFRSGQAIICLPCDGKGYQRKTNHWRSQMVGVHHDLFKRSWSEPYDKILSLIRNIDDRAKSALAVRIS